VPLFLGAALFALCAVAAVRLTGPTGAVATGSPLSRSSRS
jgi:hypothetical protein